MRTVPLLLACLLAGCKSQPAEPPQPAEPAKAAAEAAPEAEPEDVGNAEDLYQRALTLKDDRPGESIRLYRKAAQLAPNDEALVSKVKEQLGKFEPLMRDRAREAYLLGFELKESSPNDAARNFEHAMELSPRGDPIYEKAKTQLAKLKLKPAPKR